MQFKIVCCVIFIVTGGNNVFAWSKGEDVDKLPSTLSWSDAVAACLTNNSIVASPVTTSTISALLTLSISNLQTPTVPESMYWTGFRRNRPDGLTPDEWVGEFHRATNESFLWRNGFNGEEPGDCLAMEVLPLGITFYPHDCTSKLYVACHKFEVTHATEEISKDSPSSPIYHNVDNETTSEDDCARKCILDRNCEGYKYDNTVCYTLNETSFDEVIIPPAIECTSTNQTVFDIVDCLCNETSCQLASCDLSTNSTSCTFEDCSDSVICQPFIDNTCFLNGSLVFINGSNETVTSCFEVTTQAQIFTYTHIAGCVSPIKPPNTRLERGRRNTYNSTRELQCLYPYGSSQDNGTLPILTCNYDRRWSFVPFCWLDAPKCDLGWYEFDGSCYKIEETPVNWFEQTCELSNAFPVYIESWDERKFVDKLLYFHKNESFWTDGSNLNIRRSSRFYWKHNHLDITYDNWRSAPNATDEYDEQCVALKARKSSFLYYAEDCLDLKLSVCKKGRIPIGGYCLSDNWCMGGSVCSNGKCMCFYLTIYGELNDDPTAYCGYSKKVEADVMLLKLPPRQWEVALAECENQDGTLLTVLTKDWEDFLWTNYGNSGSNIQFWTGFYMNDNYLLLHGVAEYNVSHLTQIPWKTQFKTLWSNGCVYQRISMLGLRYGVKACGEQTQLSSFCKVEDHSVYFGENLDNTGKIPIREYQPVSSELGCMMKCRYLEDCVSISYFPLSMTCNLYDVKSPGSSGDPLNLHMYVTGCTNPGRPKFGSVAYPATSVGSVATFSCNAGHAVPFGYSALLNCQNGGYWDNVPKCILDGPFVCDEGWEQMNQSCYLVEDDEVSTWVNAVTKCNSLGATLAEIYSNEEMDYLKVMLDHIGRRQFLIGANCRIMQGFYSWSSYDYAMITYTKWYKGEGDIQPSGLQDCVALQRVFSIGSDRVNDTQQLFFADSNCNPLSPAKEISHPYICKKNMLNVGSTNCEMYGKDPCKQNSGCVNNTCVCKEFFYQLGADDVDTTQCLPIQPVGNGPCYDMNEFCRNNATCQNGICLCPTGYYQNGKSGSLSTLCQTNPVSCPDDWVDFNGHCYILDLTYSAPSTTTKFNYNNDQPIVNCGKRHAYMAMIPDAETNEVIWKLGTSFSYRYIGLVDEKLDEEYIWMADRSGPTYLNFEFQNKTGVPAVMMNPVGYWIKETYTRTLLTTVDPVVLFSKNQVVCEKPNLCLPIPVIANAVTPPANPSSVGEEVGTEYVYDCNRGYVTAGVDSPHIKCKEVNRVSSWNNFPQCVSLLQERFIDAGANDVNGIALGTSFVVVDNLDCAAYCYENSMCEAFLFDPSSNQCALYEIQNGGSLISVTGNSELWKSAVCDPIPYVEHATFTSTGRNFGDTVVYQCSSNYRIHRNTSSVLTCLPTGRWNYDPPVCQARFKRVKEAIYALSVTIKKNKEIHNIFTVHDCEVRCTEEHEFRCVMSVYRWGYCTLWNQFPNHHRTIERYAEHIENAMTSTLYDSELDVYDGFYGQIINTDPGIMQGVNTSYEICAQNCSYDLNNCTAFVYMPENRTCFIYHVTDLTTSISEDPQYRLFKRNYVCGEPPTLPGMTFKELIKQHNDRYSIGDLLQASCNTFGEELVAGHSGQIECLATGYWTQRLPVCRNLCGVGWYMLNLTCYKILPGPASFWEAYGICQSLDSGLVNVYDVEEFKHLQRIWNETGKPVTDVWIGLYSDFNFWYWSERLGGDIGFNEMAAPDLAVVLSLTDTSISSDSINILRPFACEKAAPKMSCPDGWTQYQTKCFQVQTTPALYDGAVAGCQSIGATLAVVDNIQEQYIVGQMATVTTGVSAYVGIQHQLYRPYKWVDGTVPRYKYILSIEPVGSVKCGVVNIGDVSISQMYFSMTTCDTAKPYICQKQLDYQGVGNDYSNLPCSTDSFCSHPDLACLGGIENGIVYPPRCSGKECPPPWFYLNNECIYAQPQLKLDYSRAAHHCWKKGGNLAVIESFKEDYDLMDAIPSGVDWYIGIYSYLQTYPIDIRTKGPAVFPYYEKVLEAGYILDTRVNRGFFMSQIINVKMSFLCEKQPTFKPIANLMYDGCFGEKTTLYERDLPFNVFTDPGMTVEMCVNHCFNNSYKYAGIMLGDTCGCGNNRGDYGKQALSECPIKCVGNQAQNCGSSTTNSVYRTSETNCFDGMPKSNTDQRRCYSYSQNQLTYYTNKLECLQQGGYNILPKTPVDEAFVYNQVLLGALSNEALLDPATTNPDVWLGLEGLVKTWADDGEVAYWVNFDNKNYGDDWKLQHICESYGGHLAVIDDQQELNFVKSFLYDSSYDTPLLLRVYWLTTNGQLQLYTYFDTQGTPTTKYSQYPYVATTCDPDCDNGKRYGFDGQISVNFTGYGGLCEISQLPFSLRREEALKCPAGWWFWNEHCYFFTGTSVYAGSSTDLYCATHRAVVLEIDSIEEQRFISNLLNRESPLPKTAHIGAKFVDPLPDGSPGQFVYGDFQPPGYLNWKTGPTNDVSLGCSVIDCSDRACTWRDISCTESWPVICESPAKRRCSAGWEEFGDKCVYINNVTASVDCSKLATFNTEAEMQEFIIRFDLGTRNCLTDGAFNTALNIYIWNSTAVPTYFTDQVLPGTGGCVGVTATGLHLIDCALYTCAICEHSQKAGVAIDNLHILDEDMTDGDVTNLYENEKYDPEVYTYLSLFSENITVTHNLALQSVLNISDNSSALNSPVGENDHCLENLGNCHHSFGVSFWIWNSNVTDCVVIDTVTDGTTGMIVSIKENGTRIAASLLELNYRTDTDVFIPLNNEWNHVNIVWQKYVGLTFFINFNLVHRVSPTDRTKVFPTMPIPVNTSYISIANCSVDPDSYLLIKDLQYGTNLKEDWENQISDDIPRFIDFNEPSDKSDTNINVKVDTALVETYWRNSLFFTAAKVDNPSGVSPAMEIKEQMAMCFTNFDACKGGFTLSLWLYPRDFLQDQIFWFSGIKSHSGGEIETMKIWYCTTTDKYYLIIHYDKTMITFEFYIYLFEWSHLVLSADLSKHETEMYLNSEKVLLKTTTFEQNRIIPRYYISFLRIGDVGTFDIDDFKFFPYAAEPSQMYVLKSCHEFMLAGITGVKNETIDPNILDDIDNKTIMECDLDLGYTGFHFAMELNQTNIVTNTIGLNTSIDYLDMGNITYAPAIHYDGVLVNNSGFNMTGLETIKCFSDVRYCYFGFTFAAWIQILDVKESLTLFELGGNIDVDKYGMRVWCENTTDTLQLNCSAVVVNGTDRWSLEFSVLKKQMLHLAVTWNPHLNLIVALNGHSTADFGRLTYVNRSIESTPPVHQRPITIGYSLYNPDQLGEFMIDELTIVDNYLEDIQIKKLFGTKHECPDMWYYSPVSDRCYFLSSTTATYDNAVSSCQSMDAILVQVHDLETRTWIYSFLDAEMLVPSPVYFGLKQLPRAAVGFQVRQPNGKMPKFPDSNLIFVTDFSIPRCVRAYTAGGSWAWTTVNCATLQHYICEMQPMYVKESPLYVNGTNKDNEEFHLNGQITLERGVTSDTLIFNNSANSSIHMIHADDCLSNFDYCHNGLAIKFWLMTVGDLTDFTSQIIFTNMMSTESHGFVIYIIREGTNYLLGIDLRNKISFKSSKVHVSSNVWTYVSIFISSESDILFYMNGEIATPVIATVNSTDTSLRNFGVSADITIGSGMKGLDAASIKMDNLTFTESNTFSALSLKNHVYEFFPRFHIPFDNPQYRLPNSQGSTCYTNEGYMGNAVFHNITYPHQLNFIGQFAYDCFGSQNLCLDGFSMFVWIMPPGYTYNYVLLNARNQNTGIIIDFRLSDFTLSNKYWLAIRDGTTIEDHYPFDLEPSVWSHIGITWYTNGTKLFFVNGILVTDAFTRVNTLDGSASVTPLQFGQTLPNTNLEIPVEAGIDEMMVIRSSIVEMDLINYYKNSTFIHREVIYEFENVNSSQEISGIWNNGARFISGKDVMNLTSLFSDSCFLDIDKCVHGFTLRFAFRFVSDLDLDQLIMTTGGHLLDGLGFSFSFTAMNTTLPFRRYFQIDVRTTDKEFTTWFNLQYGIWSDIKITWHKMFGIRVFVDDVLAVCDYSRKVARLSPPTIQQQQLLISQDGGIELGTFDMDGLRYLDVAIFEEDVLHNGDSLWVHKVHEIPDGSVLLQYTEVTRDECHQYCVENVCSGYTFCNDEHFGTCNLYSNSTNITMTTPNQTCDSFFRYSSVSIPVQDAGCLIQNTAGTLTATPLSQSVDCAWYCKNMTYVYGYTTSTTCYCADADLETLDLFNAQNLSLSQTCGAGIPIWQTLGLRDFIRPLPITSFNVTVLPQVYVFVNETVEFNFEVNEGSFAGYKIDSGDNRPTYYTSYNYSGLVYQQIGIYQVKITALNELSSITHYITIYICEPIEGVLLDHTSIVPTKTDNSIIVNVIGGNFITCDIDFGDGFNDTMFAMNASFPFVFSHQYTFEQQAMINVSCYNNLTIATNISSIIAINPIINLTVSAPYSLFFGENQTVFLDMAQGSNVSMNFFLDGQNISSLYFPNPSNFSLYSIGPDLYKTTGEHQINITVWNAVSGPFTFLELFYADIAIAEVTLTYHHFVATNQNFTSVLYIGNGSNVNVHLNFNDDIQNRTVFLDDDIQVSNWTVDFYKQYLQPGVYSIKCYLANSVSNYTIVDVIYVETAVDNITLDAYEVSNPIDDVNFTLSISDFSFSPTNALMNISYGNGYSELDIPAEFVGTSMVILYNYTENGIYNVTIDIWNNVSVISFSRVLVVGQPITNLSAIPHTFFIAIGDMLTLFVNVESGSQIQYIIDFADGEVDQKGLSYTYPDTSYVLQKSYSNAGVYMIDVYANNTFNSERIQVQINVQEKVLGMSITTRHVAKILSPMKYLIVLNQAGTNSCFHFDFGSRQHLVGGYHCLSKPEYKGMNFTYGEGDHITFYLKFYDPGNFTMVVNGSNEVSSEMFYKDIAVLEFPCSYPEVKIYGFSPTETDPTKVYSSKDFVMRAVSDTICDPLQTVLFEWTITPLDEGVDSVDMVMPTLPYLIIPSNTLQYGRYQVNVTVLIQNFLEFNDTTSVYIIIVKTPLSLLIKGNDARSVRSGSTIKTDASWSYDPDYPLTGIQFNLTWFCWFPVPGESQFDVNNANLSDIMTTGCLETLDPANVNWTVLTIPSALLSVVIGDKFYFVAMMSSGERVEYKGQAIEISDPNGPELVMKCVENCFGSVSADLPVRVKGLCETCTQQNRLNIPYLWRLFKEESGTLVEIVNFKTWTDTGVTGANLKINPGFLLEGANYQLLLESGTSYTYKSFHVIMPPYNGNCFPQSRFGEAMNSKFAFECTRWLDEGTRMNRDITVDQNYLYSYTFTFYYMIQGNSEKQKNPFFQVSGSEATTPGVVFPPGDPDFDYQVTIYVEIVDYEKSKVTESFNITVVPFSEECGDDVMTGFEMQTCVRERDMSCILTFCDGLADFNTSHVRDKELRDDVVDMIYENEDLIQDGLHMQQTSNVLSKLSGSTEKLNPESKDKVRGLMKNLVGSMETSLSSIMSVAEKEKVANGLLTTITEFCQRTKYPPGCSSGDCDQKLNQGNAAIDLITMVQNLTSLMVMGNVAGESSTVITVPYGNVKYQAQRRESSGLVNSTLVLTDSTVIQTRELPENVTELETVDVQIMTSDNLYTTHQSTQYIKSETTSFELLSFGGETIHLHNLEWVIDIYTYPSGLDNLNFTAVNLSDTTDSDMFFIELRLNETSVTPVLVLRPEDLNANITYYIKKGRVPTETDFDIMGSMQTDSSFEEKTSSYIIKLDLADLWSQGEVLPTNVYIGLKADYNVTEISPMTNVSTYVLGCFYWSIEERRWSQEGLELGPVKSLNTSICETTHLSSFGMNMFVPPNTIDFSTVFSKFSADNLAVLLTVGLVLVAYLLLLIPVVRADRRDFKKWAIYPLADNVKTDVYHYQVSVYTGIGQNAGTTTKVYFVLGGENGDTEVRLLQDMEKRPMLRGSVNNYLLSVPQPLGSLMFLRIWLDSTDKTKIDDWLLNMVLIRDVQTDEKYAFLCDRWFALDKGDGQIDHLLSVASEDEMRSFGHLFFSKTRKDLTDGHLWFSVMSRPMHSTFTRAQRLSCCLSLLFMTMITNCMWYKTDSSNNTDGDISQNVHLGPFSFSSQEFFTSLFGSLIVVPFNLIIVTLFRKSKPKTTVSSYNVKKERREKETMETQRERDCVSPSGIDAQLFPPLWDYDEKKYEPQTYEHDQEKDEEIERKKKKLKYPLPHWCVYVAWVLFALSVLAAGFFTVLYSLEWGSSISSKWLTSFMLSFIESVIMVQPLKVIILAIVVALVFKTVEADDSVEEVFVIGESPKTSVYPEHRQQFIYDPTDVDKVSDAKEYRNKMNKLFETIRTILIYVLYLVVVAVLTYENKDPNFYPTYRNLHDIFIEPHSKYDKSLNNLKTTDDFFMWMDKIVLPGLYSNGWYNDSEPALSSYISDNVFYRVGPPRIRQARIKYDVCPWELRDFVKECYPPYSSRTYESNDFGENWKQISANTTINDAWIYKDTLKLDGAPTVGNHASYSGGGYVVDLGETIQSANDSLNYLRTEKWIDRETRGVFIEFNLYNANVNLFCSIILLLEYLPSGSVFPYWEISPLVMYRYVGPSAIFLFVFDMIFVAFTLYYLYNTIKIMRKNGFKGYFLAFWQVIDFVNLILSIVVCAFYGVSFVMTKLTLEKFHENRGKFINLQRVVLWEQLFGVILGFILFLSMVKTLQLIRFNAKISQLIGTIKKSSKPLLNYMVVFLSSFMAFASCGFLLFGHQVYEYSSMLRTVETLMSMLMMKVNIDDMLVVSGVLGSLYIFIFVLFIVFVLLNILLSIINEAFEEVRKDPSFQSDDPQMFNFLLQQFKRMIWSSSEVQPAKEEDPDIACRMTKLEKRMDKYFVKFLQENKRIDY